jgi:hypothetical protein
MSHVQLLRHVARLVAPPVVNYFASRRLVVDYFASRRPLVDNFAYAARPCASARRVVRQAARRRLLHLRYASGCFGSSRGLSRVSSLTTSPTPRVRVPRHVAGLVTRLVVDYSTSRRLVVDCFDYDVRLVASARRAARRVARCRLLRLRRASGCLGTSRLVVNYFTYSARPVVSARRAACRVTHRRQLRLAQARRRLLRLCRGSGCLGTSRSSSRGSSSTAPPRAGSSSTVSTTTRIRLLRHVARLVAWLVVDYFTSAARPGASARRAARCRLLRLHRASGSLGRSRGSSSTTSPTPRVHLLLLVARLVACLIADYFASHRLVVDYFAYAARPGASARRAARRRLLRLAHACHLLL